MIDVFEYNIDKKNEWDLFVDKAKNSTFLFFRDYMDYHSDRFVDNSLMFYKNSHLVALLPANRIDDKIYSHQGLSYGGLILSVKNTAIDVLSIFSTLIDYCKQNKISEIVYKSIPYFYSQYPAQEDLYALFKNNATLVGCNISSTIQMRNKLKFVESRKSGVRKSIKNDLKCFCSSDFDSFWTILEANLLEKHSVNPVHSLGEIAYLSDKFQENIKLFNVYKDDEVVAGTVLYINKNTVHVQYISANALGKELGALDFLFDYLINNYYVNFDYFDFGQSTENLGAYLNENLIFQKEGFGGRATAYNIYIVKI